MAGIRVTLLRRPDGSIAALASRGHARGRAEANLPCAMVSWSLKNFVGLLAGRPGVELRAALPEPGSLSAEIGGVAEADRDWYRGCCDLLVHSLAQARDAHPDDIEIDFQTVKQEL